MSAFWLGVWIFALACTWLLPNHYRPWAAFHADAWCAVVLSIASAAVILRSRSPLYWHGSDAMVALLVCIPWLQYLAGLVSFAGQAWISTAYLLGLLLAMKTGKKWEQDQPDQLADGLFWAVGVASVFSVNLQLQTWLGLIDTGIFDIWSMGLSGPRPYANIGQPNQLATLLLWGLLACAWIFNNGKIKAPVALLAACFLLVGVALTQSRTAWLGLVFMVGATWTWRRLWRSKWVPWCASILLVLFWLCIPLLRELSEALLLGSDRTYFRGQIQGDLRFAAWRMFIDAAWQRPWFGYGWTEVGHAQLAVAASFPPLAPVFAHSHNLFLDLVLWLGLPIGLSVSVAALWWFGTRMQAIANAKDALLWMFLGVIAIHAMLEFPLHYAYFLLPTGLVVGVINCRGGKRPLWIAPRWTLMALWLAATLLLSGIVRDYFRVESSFQELRFELARIGTLPPGKPADVALLTQLRDRIASIRYEAKPGMSTEELAWLTHAAKAYPGGGALYKTAKALALNGRPQEARQWLEGICKIAALDECERIKRVWAQDARDNRVIALVPWPD